MNEYIRYGKGEEYMEVSVDWETLDVNKCVLLLIWLEQIVGEDSKELLHEASQELWGK